jgi:hypothetical protein
VELAIAWQHIGKVTPRGAMTWESNPTTNRGKLGPKRRFDRQKRHILTDKNGIPMPAVITPASTPDIKAVTDVVDNAAVNKQPQPTSPAIMQKPRQ